MMNEEQKQAFLYEIINWNNIPITSKSCKVGCIFCKVNHDPALKRYPAIPNIELSELFEGFEYLDPNYRFVRLGAGVLVAPHSDPFIHPDIIEFLEITSKRFPLKTVVTVTTGSHIKPEYLPRLNAIPNYGIDLSLITLQEPRESLMALTTRPEIENLLKNGPVRKISLMYTGSIDELDKDLRILDKLDLIDKVEEVLIRRIEVTKGAPQKLKEISFKSVTSYPDAVSFVRQNWPTIKCTIPYLTPQYKYHDTEYFQEADSRLQEIINYIAAQPTINNAIVLTPDSTHEYFSEALSMYPRCKVVRVKNHTYGGSVTVAGLLTNDDFFRPIQSLRKHSQIILPREAYDSEGNDLFGKSFKALGGNLQHEIELM